LKSPLDFRNEEEDSDFYIGIRNASNLNDYSSYFQFRKHVLDFPIRKISYYPKITDRFYWESDTYFGVVAELWHPSKDQ